MNWNEVSLAVIRHPVSWALSTMSRSYELYCDRSSRIEREQLPGGPRLKNPPSWAEVGRRDPKSGAVVKNISWPTVLNGSCTWYPDNPSIQLKPVPRVADGLAGVWNYFYNSYLAAPNTQFLRYEDMVRNPVAAGRLVAAAARCDLAEWKSDKNPGIFSVRQGYYFSKSSSKVSADEDAALLAQDWRAKISPELLVAFCERVDAALLRLFNYTCVDYARAPPRPPAAPPRPPAADRGHDAPPLEARNATLEARVAALEARVAALEAQP